MSEAATEPAVEPEAVEPADEPVEQVAPETVAPPAPEYITVEDAEAIANARIQGFMEELAQFVPPEGEAPTGEPGFELDLLSDTAGADLARFIAGQNQSLLEQVDRRIQQIQAPLAQAAESEQIQRGEQRLQDMLADDVSRNGEFSPDPDADKKARVMARTLADSFFPVAAQRYGNGPRAAEAAMVQAAAYVREVVGSARTSGAQQEVNRLATLAGASGEPGSTGAGVVTSPAVPLDNHSLALKYGRQAKAIRD